MLVYVHRSKREANGIELTAADALSTGVSQVKPPPPAELRAKLLIGSEPPTLGGTGATHALCTTEACAARAGVNVYTRRRAGDVSGAPPVFDTDTIFELTAAAYTASPSARKPARFLLNRVSTVHVGSSNEYELLSFATVEEQQSHAFPCEDHGQSCLPPAHPPARLAAHPPRTEGPSKTTLTILLRSLFLPALCFVGVLFCVWRQAWSPSRTRRSARWRRSTWAPGVNSAAAVR